MLREDLKDIEDEHRITFMPMNTDAKNITHSEDGDVRFLDPPKAPRKYSKDGGIFCQKHDERKGKMQREQNKSLEMTDENVAFEEYLEEKKNNLGV